MSERKDLVPLERPAPIAEVVFERLNPGESGRCQCGAPIYVMEVMWEMRPFLGYAEVRFRHDGYPCAPFLEACRKAFGL